MPPNPTSRRSDLPVTSRDIAGSNSHLNQVFGGIKKSWMNHAVANSHSGVSDSNGLPNDPLVTVVTSDIISIAKKRRGRPREVHESTSEHSVPPVFPPVAASPNPQPGSAAVPLPSPALTSEPSPAYSDRQITPQTEVPAGEAIHNRSSPPVQNDQYRDIQHAPADTSVSAPAEHEVTVAHEPVDDTTPSQQPVSLPSLAATPGASETHATKRARAYSSEAEDAATVHQLKRARVVDLTETEIAANRTYQLLMGKLGEKLRKRIDRAGGLQSMSSIERHRYKYLLEACSKLDGFYLVLHQLYCAWTERCSTVHQLLAPIPAAKVDKAFDILQHILLRNEDLGQEHREHFANWPRKLTDLESQTSRSMFYQRHLPQVRNFADNLADKWRAVLDIIERRGFPMLANEPMHTLGCWSVVMRKSLFTVSRRLLGVKDRHAAHVNTLWDHDQAVEIEALKGSMSMMELDKHRLSFRTQYATATADARRKAHLLDSDSESRSLTPSSNYIPPPASRVGASSTASGPSTLNPSNQPQDTNTMAPASTNRPEGSSAVTASLHLSPIISGIPERPAAVAAIGNAQQIQARPQRQDSNNVSATVLQDAVQPVVSRPKASSGPSPAGVPPYTRDVVAQAQPHTSIRALDSQPASNSQRVMTGSFRSNSERTVLASTPSPSCASQPIQSHRAQLPDPLSTVQLAQSHRHVQAFPSQPSPHAIPFQAPLHHAEMQQHGSVSQHAPNWAPSQVPQYGEQAHQTQQAMWSNFTAQQVPQSHETRQVANQMRSSDGELHPGSGQSHIMPHFASDPNARGRQLLRFVSQVAPSPMQQQQFYSSPQVHQPAPTPQSQSNFSSLHHNGSPPIYQATFPTVMTGPNSHQLGHAQNASMPARGRTQQRPQNQMGPVPTNALAPTPVIPDNEPPNSPHGWVSAHVASHLPRLRSPLRKPMPGTSGRHYQYMDAFRFAPQRVHPGFGVRSMTFEMSPEDLAFYLQKTQDLVESDVQPYVDGARRLRLRCCCLPEQATVSAATWAGSSTTWPSEVYLSFNGHRLIPPRKRHFRYDLPVELTDLLVAGKNELKLVVPESSALKERAFLFAIETILVSSHETILKTVAPGVQSVDASQMKKEIAKRLSSHQDEEVQVTSSSGLTITLKDPWTSVMFELPVRGRQCRHFECFDLKTYLETRPSKPTQHSRKFNQEPSLVDCWKCPICDEDARPCSLNVDMFMLEVRQQLVASGRGNSKAIVAQADGSWSAVEEPDDDEDDLSARGDQTSSTPADKPPTQVIEIIDD